MMKPILFNTEMVRAILDGRKTVTRRIIKPQPVCYGPNMAFDSHNGDFFLSTEKNWLRCRMCGHDPEYSREGSNIAHHWEPPYLPGDFLYVRETWSFWPCYDCDNEMCYGRGISYKDTDGCFAYKTQRSKVPYDEKWRPSIHMPKEAARIFIRVTAVRVERLQNISADGCAMEGVWPLYSGPIGGRAEYYLDKFSYLWDSTIPKADLDTYGWKENPWVWVIEFERCEKPEDE